jgi:hypothetical protein
MLWLSWAVNTYPISNVSHWSIISDESRVSGVPKGLPAHSSPEMLQFRFHCGFRDGQLKKMLIVEHKSKAFCDSSEFAPCMSWILTPFSQHIFFLIDYACNSMCTQPFSRMTNTKGHWALTRGLSSGQAHWPWWLSSPEMCWRVSN